MNINDRIRAYLGRVPGAVAGQGGHAATFKLACLLYNGFALSEDETVRWLKEWNQTCQPAWSEKELRHKAAESVKAAHQKPRGHLLDDKTGAGRRPSAVVVLRKLAETCEPAVLWRGRLTPMKRTGLLPQKELTATDATDVSDSSEIVDVLQAELKPPARPTESKTSVASVAEGQDWLVQEVAKRFGAKIIDVPDAPR